MSSEQRYVPSEREAQLLGYLHAALGVIEYCARTATMPVGGSPLTAVEREAILQTLRLTRGNQTHAAGILGITTKTLLRKMREYGIASAYALAEAAHA